jgi:hypothetical protein
LLGLVEDSLKIPRLVWNFRFALRDRWQKASVTKRICGVTFSPILVLAFLWVHLWRSGVRAGLIPGFPRLHTNASGDFTLLARDAWLALRGYAEFDMYSMHLDSLFCHAAHQSGVRELVLTEPMQIYHIEHGSGWTPEGEARLNARLAAAGIPQLSFPELEEYARQMHRERKHMFFSDENWGLAQEDLPETLINSDCLQTSST